MPTKTSFSIVVVFLLFSLFLSLILLICACVCVCVPVWIWIWIVPLWSVAVVPAMGAYQIVIVFQKLKKRWIFFIIFSSTHHNCQNWISLFEFYLIQPNSLTKLFRLGVLCKNLDRRFMRWYACACAHVPHSAPKTPSAIRIMEDFQNNNT